MELPQLQRIILRGSVAQMCTSTPPLGDLSDEFYPEPYTNYHPMCTHAMFLTSGSNRFSMFRFKAEALRDRRPLIYTVLREFSNYYRFLDYKVEILDLEFLTLKSVRNSLAQTQWNGLKMDFSAILDMTITSTYIDQLYYFSLGRDLQGCVKVVMNTKAGAKVNLCAPFLKGFEVTSLPLYLNPPTESVYNVFGAIDLAENGREFVFSTSHVDNNLSTSMIALVVPRTEDLRRSLYLYFSAIAGPLSADFAGLRCHQYVADKAVVIELFLIAGAKTNSILKQLQKIMILAHAATGPKIFMGTIKLVQAQGPDSDTGVLNNREIASMEIMPINKNDIRDTRARTSHNYIAFHIYTGRFSPFPVDMFQEMGLLDSFVPEDLRELSDGLPAQSFSDKELSLLSIEPPAIDPIDPQDQISKARLKRLLKKSQRAKGSEGRTISGTSVRSKGKVSSESESEVEDDDNTVLSPEEEFTYLSKSIIDTKIAITQVEHELNNIRIQCSRCDELQQKKQQLMVMEVFLRIKQILKRVVPENSDVLSELSNKQSKLYKSLIQSGIREIIQPVTRAMKALKDIRPDLAMPKYTGEPLMYLPSDELRNAFITLLARVQADSDSCLPVPAKFKLPDFESVHRPDSIEVKHIEELRAEKQSLDEFLLTQTSDFEQAKQEGAKCMILYKNYEHLVVGAVFKAFIMELRNVSISGNWFDEARDPESAVSSRMTEMSIPNLSILKKIIIYLKAYRNPAAHPELEKVDKKSVGELFGDFQFLKDKVVLLDEAFRETKTIQDRIR